MKLSRLQLHQFKNHTSLDLQLDNDIVGICGLNGKGKTNILDAIYFLAVGKSYFSSTDIQCIQIGKEEAGIIGKLESNEEIEFKLKLKRGSKKQLFKNEVVYPKLADHLGELLCVMIAPGDIGLIYGDNSDRRRFVNQVLSQTDSEYLKGLMQYRRLLEQRNRHLKSGIIDGALLDALDALMLPLNELIFHKRKELLREIGPMISKFYEQISEKAEQVSLDYDSQISAGNLEEQIRGSRQKDSIIKRSHIGIHKDKIEFSIESKALKKFGSQGQIKSFLIALKLSEFNYYLDNKKTTPILLLDDIFEKIDNQRSQALIRIIKNGNFGQVFVTDTDKSRLSSFCSGVSESYKLVEL
ncbi:MAG: DNA replication and repair protein RecF [Bacteroidia bacterium]